MSSREVAMLVAETKLGSRKEWKEVVIVECVEAAACRLDFRIKLWLSYYSMLVPEKIQATLHLTWEKTHCLHPGGRIRQGSWVCCAWRIA